MTPYKTWQSWTSKEKSSALQTLSPDAKEELLQKLNNSHKDLEMFSDDDNKLLREHLTQTIQKDSDVVKVLENEHTRDSFVNDTRV